MRAMILAAGLGTRLRPLTRVRPKALVPLLGMPLLDFWIRQLYQAGCEAVVVNAFHLHERIVAAIAANTWPLPVQARIEPVLLGTAGGIRNVLEFFREEPFIVVNSDIVCRTSLSALFQRHLESGSEASLLLHDCPPFNHVAVNDKEFILGFGKDAWRLHKERSDVRLLAFTGIHCMQPAIFKNLRPGQPAEIIPLYRELIRQGRPPRALFDPSLYWREIGSVEAYRNMSRELCNLPEGILPPLLTGNPLWVHPEARIAPGVKLKGMIAVGRRSQIMQGSELEETIVWDGVRVERDTRLRGCIVADDAVVSGVHDGEVIWRGEP